MTPVLRTRIAPTPSGFLHTGNALNFVYTWLLARKTKGILRLRIDDMDTPRLRTEYLDDIFQTLDWLGLDWDEGPRNATEQRSHYTQQLRTSRYNDCLQELVTSGYIYACTCSRKEIATQLQPGQHPDICRHKKLSLTHPNVAWRVYVPENTSITFTDCIAGPVRLNLFEAIGDFIVKRKDGIPAYQIISLCDDLDFGINCVVRGLDLLGSTAAQLYLSQLLNQPAFQTCTFHHHPLINDDRGNKLSKSAGSASLKHWRESGKSVQEFYHYISMQLKCPGKPSSAQALLQMIDISTFQL